MRYRNIRIFSFFALLFFVSCDKNETRVSDFFVNFATVTNNESSLSIELDSGEVLTSNLSYSNDLDIKDRSRVIINYTPLENNLVKINNIQQIFLGYIEDKNIEDLNSDPIKIISIDRQGNYLNISFQAEYHSKPHSASLLRDFKVEEPKLYLSYSRENDPSGALTQMYISFKLDGLQNKNISIYVNTYEGKRKYDR